jgi:hypothetical protein
MRAKFADADYLAAAQAIVVEHGPGAATVASISERLRAPMGSFIIGLHRATFCSEALAQNDRPRPCRGA